MADNNAQEQPNQLSTPPVEQAKPYPIYRKPTIRRYDQIEQVKPYGPSEKEAG